jgi:hypothetical protein
MNGEPDIKIHNIHGISYSLLMHYRKTIAPSLTQKLLNSKLAIKEQKNHTPPNETPICPGLYDQRMIFFNKSDPSLISLSGNVYQG